MMHSTKLLLISNHYLTFVKDQNEIISESVSEINALIRTNYYHHILKKKHLIDSSEMPTNIFVEVTPVLYYPTDSQYKKLGEKHFKAAEKMINLNNIEFDLIHSHFTWSAGYVGAKLKEKYDMPFVVTAHGYDIYDLPFKDDEWKQKIEYVLNTADCIITVSNSNLRCIEKLDVDTPVKVIPNGFNDKIFHPMNSEECRKTLNLPIDKKIILTVGNLAEVKGHKYLIEAMSEIVKHRKDVLCIIVGSGKLKGKLEKQIKNLNLKNYVKLVGGKPHNEIPIWMNACDVFVLPSLNEGNPTVMFECLGCGKPFIGTRVGGVPEIITSDDFGLLCELADSDGLANNLLIAPDKEWDIKKIEGYSSQFTWDAISKDVLNVYSKIDSI